MTEYKPGKYRFPNGHEVVVLWAEGKLVRLVNFIDRGTESIHKDYMEGAEYLGPAVIGDESVDAVLEGFQKLFVKTMGLEKDRDEYRRKWDEESDHVARLQTALHEVTRERDEAVRLRVSDVKADLADNARLRKELDDLRWVLDIRSVDADGVEWYRFDSVTVAVREGKEAYCTFFEGEWYAACTNDTVFIDRKDAEAWCRKQLVPVEEWRPATPEDVAGKPECRVRVGKGIDWCTRTLLAHDDRSLGGPWVTLDRNGNTRTWPICEVRK